MRRGLAYAALGGVLLLAPACQSEPEPRFGPPESPSPSSTRPEPTPSDQPEAMTPEQTVRAWVEARNAALQDGDTRAMQSLSGKPCPGCDNFVSGIEDVYGAGGSYDTPGWTVLKTARVALKLIDVRVRIAAGVTIDAKGEQPTSYPATVRDLRFTLSGEGSTWRIRNIVFLQR